MTKKHSKSHKYLFLAISFFFHLESSEAMDKAREQPTGRGLRHYVNQRLNSGVTDNLKVDIAIIGGGVGGLYSAYRLTNDPAYKDKKVHVFEMSNRIGGRLESVEIPNANLVGELGGMRYLNTQGIVTSLIEQEFNLDNEKFPMGEDSRLLGYYRTQHMKASAWVEYQEKKDKFPTHYHLHENHKGFNTDQLFNKVIYDVLTKSDWFLKKYSKGATKDPDSDYKYTFSLSRKDWDDVKLNLTYCFETSPYNGNKSPYANIKLNSLGFWNILKDQVGQEGYNFLADAGAYYSNTINWNAAEAFPYIVGDFTGTNVEYRTITGGYDLIAYKLAEQYLESSKEATIWSQKKLVSFEHTTVGNGYRYTLSFLNVPTQAQWTIYTNQIILAMPRRSLELLDQNNFFFRNEHLQNNIRSVIMEPACKILLGFESSWWEDGKDNKKLFGRSVTDLPMRQCYYFGTDPNNSHSLLLASYNDMTTVPFWIALAYRSTLEKHKIALEKSKKERGVLDISNNEFLSLSTKEREKEGEVKVFGLRNFTTDEGFKTRSPGEINFKMESFLHSLDSNPCLTVMVDELMNQLQELHTEKKSDAQKSTQVQQTVKVIPTPYVAMFKDWSLDPYGGAYHAWQPSYPINNVVSYMRKPSYNETIFICGEAYSNQQGWVEGAFCIAEKMLQDHFKLSWPIWLDENYYLGW